MLTQSKTPGRTGAVSLPSRGQARIAQVLEAKAEVEKEPGLNATRTQRADAEFPAQMIGPSFLAAAKGPVGIVLASRAEGENGE